MGCSSSSTAISPGATTSAKELESGLITKPAIELKVGDIFTVTQSKSTPFGPFEAVVIDQADSKEDDGTVKFSVIQLQEDIASRWLRWKLSSSCTDGTFGTAQFSQSLMAQAIEAYSSRFVDHRRYRHLLSGLKAAATTAMDSTIIKFDDRQRMNAYLFLKNISEQYRARLNGPKITGKIGPSVSYLSSISNAAASSLGPRNRSSPISVNSMGSLAFSNSITSASATIDIADKTYSTKQSVVTMNGDYDLMRRYSSSSDIGHIYITIPRTFKIDKLCLFK
jgi:hypothetical protein